MLYSFGSNGNGQLSLGNGEDTHVPTVCQIPEDFPTTTPKQIVAGGNHTLVLFPCGRLFATGSNVYGQCGIQISAGTSYSRFQEVSNPPHEEGDAKWAFVSAGWDFSILVSAAGTIYSCGFGSKGELGLGVECLSTETKRLNAFSNSPIVSVASGMAHTLVVLESGEVYGWGAARKGQLGTPLEKTICLPRKVELNFRVAKAVCGREFSFVISKDGNRHSILGGSERFSLRGNAPSEGELKGWKEIGAGWGSIVVLLKDGSLRAWGRNDRGQLPPNGLEKVKEMAIGSEHGVALVHEEEKPKLVAWGWGEHGNCGKTREDGGGDVVGEIFEVRVTGDGVLRSVAAGCATSWAWAQ